MQTKHLFPLFLLFTLAGCNTETPAGEDLASSDETLGSESEEDGSYDAGTDESGNAYPETFEFQGTVFASQAPGVEAPTLAGATVCVESTGQCATTEEDGSFQIDDVPNGLDTWLVLTAPEHYETRLPFATEFESLSVRVSIWPRATIAFLAASLGHTADPTTGHVIGNLHTNREDTILTNFAVTSETAEGVGPIYGTADGASLEPGPETGGSWGWANLEPGEYTFEFAHSTYDCPPNELTGPRGEVNEVTVPIAADTVVELWIRRCEPTGAANGSGGASSASFMSTGSQAHAD